MKFKRILKIGVSIFIIAIVVIVPTIVLPIALAKKGKDNTQEPNDNLSGIVSMWHIETFEGGSLPRTKFLSARAIELEKLYPGLLVSIIPLSIDEAAYLLAEGKAPDMVSFGVGAGNMFLELAQEYTGQLNVRSELVEAGTYKGKVKAVAYMMGGYCVVADTERIAESAIDTNGNLRDNIFTANYYYSKSKKLRYSVSAGRKYNIPLYAVKDLTASQNSLHFAAGQYEAYEAYMGGVSTMLLGTQRDLNRIISRNSLGNMPPYQVQCLGGFSDLIQYIAIISKDSYIQLLSTKVIEYLTSDLSQSNLSKIGMLSVNRQSIYFDGELMLLEKALSKDIKTPSAFVSASKLEALHQLTLKAISGDTSARKELDDKILD